MKPVILWSWTLKASQTSFQISPINMEDFFSRFFNYCVSGLGLQAGTKDYRRSHFDESTSFILFQSFLILFNILTTHFEVYSKCSRLFIRFKKIEIIHTLTSLSWAPVSSAWCNICFTHSSRQLLGLHVLESSQIFSSSHCILDTNLHLSVSYFLEHCFGSRGASDSENMSWLIIYRGGMRRTWTNAFCYLAQLRGILSDVSLMFLYDFERTNVES